MFYRVIEHDSDEDPFFINLELSWEPDYSNKWHRNDIAEDCAKHYYNNHDGWESDWPLTIAIYASEESKEISRHSVYTEPDIIFNASEI